MSDVSEPKHLDLVDRLRGEYHLPVNDGAGPLNGSMTFSRKFETPPIQHEAAAEIARLRREKDALEKVLWAVREAIEDDDLVGAEQMIKVALRSATETKGEPVEESGQ